MTKTQKKNKKINKQKYLKKKTNKNFKKHKDQ